MLSDKKANFLITVYGACQEKLTEQAKQRDQVITFYIVLCAFFLGWVDEMEFSMALLIGLAMLVIGGICVYRVCKLRSWNLQYVKCIKILNGLFLSDKEYTTQREIETYILSHISGGEKVSPRTLFTSIGNITALGFSLITTVPFISLVFQILGIDGVCSILLCLAYIGGYCMLSGRCLLHCLREGIHRKTWILMMPSPTE